MESVLKDISQYFQLIKDIGQESINISRQSLNIINEWGLVWEGNVESKIYFIDKRSLFFKGEPGALLIKIIKAMKLSRESVCICNAPCSKIVKYRVKRVNPKIMITLGRGTTERILKTNAPFEYTRGRFHDFNGIKVMPTWHPVSLLEDVRKKRDVWEDMKKVMNYISE